MLPGYPNADLTVHNQEEADNLVATGLFRLKTSVKNETPVKKILEETPADLVIVSEEETPPAPSKTKKS